MLEGSIYQYISGQYRLGICGGPLTNEAVLPTPEQKEPPGIGDCTLLQTSHPSCLADGRPFEYTITCYVNSRIVYTYSYPQRENRTYNRQYTGKR